MDNLRCLIYINKVTTKSTVKGQAKLCITAYNKNNCRCQNCKTYNSLRQNNYRKNNKEKLKQYYKEYRKNNSEKIKQYRKGKIYAKISREKSKIYSKNYIDKNRERVREIWRNKDRRRRATIKNNGFEKYSENDVIDLYGSKCYLCSKEIDMNATRLVGSPGWEKGLHIEHVIDIAKGGPDTLANVRPAHALCNLTKKPVEMV